MPWQGWAAGERGGEISWEGHRGQEATVGEKATKE